MHCKEVFLYILAFQSDVKKLDSVFNSFEVSDTMILGAKKLSVANISFRITTAWRLFSL